jgi:oxepin-CoA hydrolase/3-oxo-5,6-dehydrosuberyl-CoA semialdehyde dehydrogenase
MPTLPFDVNDEDLRDAFLRTGVLAALDALDGAAVPRWGRMTAQEMVEHLVWAFECSTGEVEVACPTPPEELPRLKKFLSSRRLMPREFMNPALRGGLPPSRFATLGEARDALASAVERFRDQWRTHPQDVHIHPVFGPISAEEWSRTHFKHCAHHLQQFGLLELETPPEAP